MTDRALRFLLRLSIASAILLAFAWPAVVETDPADRMFEWIGKSTLLVFVVTLAAILARRLRREE